MKKRNAWLAISILSVVVVAMAAALVINLDFDQSDADGEAPGSASAEEQPEGDVDGDEVSEVITIFSFEHDEDYNRQTCRNLYLDEDVVVNAWMNVYDLEDDRAVRDGLHASCDQFLAADQSVDPEPEPEPESSGVDEATDINVTFSVRMDADERAETCRLLAEDPSGTVSVWMEEFGYESEFWVERALKIVCDGYEDDPY